MSQRRSKGANFSGHGMAAHAHQTHTEQLHVRTRAREHFDSVVAPPLEPYRLSERASERGREGGREGGKEGGGVLM